MSSQCPFEEKLSATAKPKCKQTSDVNRQSDFLAKLSILASFVGAMRVEPPAEWATKHAWRDRMKDCKSKARKIIKGNRKNTD